MHTGAIRHTSKFLDGLFQLFVHGKRIDKISTKDMTATERKMQLHHIIQRELKSSTPTVSQSQIDHFQGQLTTLNSLMKAWGSTTDSQIIQKFCESSFQNARKDGSQPVIFHAAQVVGKLIFLADMDLKNTASLISQLSVEEAGKQIHITFENKLSSVKNQLVSQKKEHIVSQLQSDIISASIQTPQQVANLLITSTGQLNLAIGHTIADYLFDGDYSEEYEKDICRVIDTFSQSQDLQTNFMLISKPSDPTYFSNILIRATLGLAPNEVITDVHARKVALGALMSNLRQGPVGSCFATYFGIEILELRLDKAISDFAAILKNDELSRFVDGEKRDFDYVLHISDDDIRSQITVTKDALVGNIPLWSSPGIRSACQQMGGTDVKQIIQKAISNLALKAQSIQTSPEAIIQAMASIIDPKNIKQNLVDTGKIAFSAQTNCPLLRAWESCIASMAEARPESLVRSQIMSCVQGALLKPMTPSRSGDRPIIQKIQQVFNQTLQKNMTVRFDPSVSTQSVSGDGHSTEGAFIPFKESSTATSSTTDKIDTPEKFRDFVWDQFTITNQTLTNQISSSSDRKTMIETIKKIQSFIKKDSTFLQLCLTNYDNGNRQVKDPLKNWTQLEHTPWVDKTGNDNREVMDVYLENKQPITTVRFTPKNPQDLLSKLIGFFKEQQATYKYLDDETPDQVFPCDTPTHAFSALAEHPSIIPAVQSMGSPDSWITERMINPGVEIANSVIIDQYRTAVLNRIRNTLIPDWAISQFNTLVQKMGSNLTIRQFRSNILSIIQTCMNPRSSTLTEMAQYIDTYIVQDGLSIDMKKKLPIIHIADTNWNDGEKEIHFCVYYNPGDQTIQFGMITDDDTDMMVAAVNDWVTNQEWRLFRTAVNL